MSKLSELFNYLRECPQLYDLWSIGAIEDNGVKVILPQGASETVAYNERMDVCGNYECETVPYPSVYEDYRINCYTLFDSADDSTPGCNINVGNFDDVQKICDWIAEQNENGNLPKITGLNVVSVECKPFVPQIQYVDVLNNIVAYFITIRLRYVNTAKRRCIVYDGKD